MLKIVIFLVFCSFAGSVFSQTPMQLLASIESPFVSDTSSWSVNIKGSGDINGDGYNDIVLAGQPLGSGNGCRDVYIYLGGSTLNTDPDYIIPDPSEPEAAGPNNYFGSAIAYNGDLNGDGYCDLVISDYLYGWYEWGRVYVYFGGPDFNTTPDLILDGLDYGSQTEVIGLNFGSNIDISGDFNGDGFNDLVVSSEHGNLCHYGQVDIFFGGPDLDTTCDWFYYGDMCEEFGYELAVGDINGDGFSDLAAISIFTDYINIHNQVVKIFLGGHIFDNQLDASYGEFDTNEILTLLMETDFNNDSYDDLVYYRGHAFYICWGSDNVEMQFDLWHSPPPTNLRSIYSASFNNNKYLCYGTPQLETFSFFRWDNSEGMVLDYAINENYNPYAGMQQSYFLGDVNGDGHNEILLSNRTSSPILFKLFTTENDSNSIDDNVMTSPLQLSAYPNPFTQSLSLTYNLKEPGMIELAVYNVKGQLVANISSDYRRIGQHNEIWDGRDSLGRKLPSGVYLVKLSVCDKYIICKKVTLCY
ncbi:MAG: FlgD immunoglobulin-like domain containing protein [Candidatus Cloacimonadaceae bacterium]|jgi:hypothetical protein|nr:FG-GAP-like repeat-containing protein [Candidatus Cloacimonadota bacterium]MDY0112135.1 FG-GAP-like repeat-containing protein [Candidatus Syntrophosphaera sp.]